METTNSEGCNMKMGAGNNKRREYFDGRYVFLIEMANMDLGCEQEIQASHWNGRQELKITMENGRCNDEWPS